MYSFIRSFGLYVIIGRSTGLDNIYQYKRYDKAKLGKINEKREQ